MKTVYFFRHGQTNTNFHKNVYSSPQDSLSELGHQQAKQIAERCAALPIEVLISSTFERARQTAAYISEKISLTPIESDLFVECQFISKYHSKPRQEEAEEALIEIHKRWGEPGFRVDDEENYEDIVERSDKAIEFLLARPEQHIGVVTHGLFVRHLIARAIFGKLYSPDLSTVVSVAMESQNTGMSILHYDQEQFKNGWRLYVWNDHAHLG